MAKLTCVKVKYPNEEEAIRSGFIFHGKRLYTYYCDACQAIHLTSQEPYEPWMPKPTPLKKLARTPYKYLVKRIFRQYDAKQRLAILKELQLVPHSTDFLEEPVELMLFSLFKENREVLATILSRSNHAKVTSVTSDTVRSKDDR